MKGESVSCIIAFVTVPSMGHAQTIAGRLVKEKLAACVNIVPRVSSVFIWEGKLHREDECLLVIKARARSFAKIDARVRGLHPYKVPEIIAVPLAMVSRPYLS